MKAMILQRASKLHHNVCNRQGKSGTDIKACTCRRVVNHLAPIPIDVPRQGRSSLGVLSTYVSPARAQGPQHQAAGDSALSSAFSASTSPLLHHSTMMLAALTLASSVLVLPTPALALLSHPHITAAECHMPWTPNGEGQECSAAEDSIRGGLDNMPRDDSMQQHSRPAAAAAAYVDAARSGDRRRALFTDDAWLGVLRWSGAGILATSGMAALG
jgi:hypothetical protein